MNWPRIAVTPCPTDEDAAGIHSVASEVGTSVVIDLGCMQRSLEQTADASDVAQWPRNEPATAGERCAQGACAG